MMQPPRAGGWFSYVLIAAVLVVPAVAAPPASQPAKVYVPYDKLKGVFEAEGQGVFLPYDQFRALWRKAQGAPARVLEAPTPYLISRAQFTGKVDGELARLQLRLTVDILADGWVEVPIGLGDVAVEKVSFADTKTKPAPLLRVVGGQYRLLTRGTGRRELIVDFVRQLVTQPGLNVLGFRIPPAAISTLELTIPEENMKVDVEPMLAAGTEQTGPAGKKATRLQAFLGSAQSVKLSWKPKTQAAADLEPVVISEQLQHIDVAEALVRHEVRFTYDIRRRGVDRFTVQLPEAFRVTSVEGKNLSKWDIAKAGKAQNLAVTLFSAVKGRYELTVKMELFLKDPDAALELFPVVTQGVLRRTGLVAVTRSPRRSVELTGARNLARVDTGRLPKDLRGRPGATAWRFLTADYGGTLTVGTVSPRITAAHLWALGIDSDRLELRGRLQYTIERTGVFQLSLNLPEPWKIASIGPANLVDDFQLSGAGAARTVNILLKREVSGGITLELKADAPRDAPDAPVDFALPLADAKDLRLYTGQLLLLLADRLRMEVEQLQQLQSLPVARANRWTKLAGLSPTMAFEFRAIDRAKPAGAKLKIAVKPPQVSAVVHRLVSIQPGSIEEQALVDYAVLYAPVDTFYLAMPESLADAGVRITGPDIKEKPRIDALPADQKPAGPATQPAGTWAYYKIVLQSPVIGRYRLAVNLRRSFQAGAEGKAAAVEVRPILAAGKLSDQMGYVAVAKAETLVLGEPTVKTNLLDGDPSSAADLPEAGHRASATLAYRYNAPPFALSLPVATQREAAVFTTIATGAIVEQVLGRDGGLNTHATFLLDTSKGDRLAVTLPTGAKVFSVLLNGTEAPVEAGTDPNTKIVRLPPSAGQVAKLVLEFRYGLDRANALALAAPKLPDGVPVQQTLWRLRLPSEDYLLWFRDTFARIGSGEGQLATLAAGYPAAVSFKFDRQGQAFDFVRQGPPGTLAVRTAGKETFSIVSWVLVLVVGIAAVKLGGFERCVLVLVAATALIVVHLFAPLLARRFVIAGWWSGLIVLGLWLAHWLFKHLPKQIAARPKKPVLQPVAAGAGEAAESPPRPDAPPNASGHTANDGNPNAREKE